MSEKLKTYFEELNISYSEEQMSWFDQYRELVLEKNQFLNLTAITDQDDFDLKHYADSCVIYHLPEYKGAQRILDLGTGGGFPGAPLAFLNPDKQFVLADSLNKRVTAVSEMLDQVGIQNVETIHGRAEELGRKKEYRDQFDVCVSRAVSNLSVLVEYCLPFVREGGFFIAYKGDHAEEEIEAARGAIHLLNGEILRVEEVSLAEFRHTLVIIQKVGGTPKKYPRKPGTPQRQPLK